MREYFGYLSREHPIGPVEETLPPMRWRIEPIFGLKGRPIGWELNPDTVGLELYPLTMTLVAEAVVRGNLTELKQCEWQECRKFFVLKKQPGTRANFCNNICNNNCRINYYNFQRASEGRINSMYKATLSLAKKADPLTNEEMRKVETYMGVEEFENFKSRLRSGIARPKLSDATRERFKAPRPKRHSRSTLAGFQDQITTR